MNYSRVRTVKRPTRGTKLSAGIDFFVPQAMEMDDDGEVVEMFNEFNPTHLKDLKNKNPGINISEELIVLKPHERVMIPSGVRINLEEVFETQWTVDTPTGPARIARERDLFGVPLGLMLTAHNKSGVGTKKGLDRLAEVVDEDYQGELHISVVNTSNDEVHIRPGDKLIQFILEPVLLSMPNELPDEDLFKSESERGSGGFGSTGDK